MTGGVGRQRGHLGIAGTPIGVFQQTVFGLVGDVAPAEVEGLDALGCQSQHQASRGAVATTTAAATTTEAGAQHGAENQHTQQAQRMKYIRSPLVFHVLTFSMK